MCFYVKQTKDAQALEARFNAKVEIPAAIAPAEVINGFSHAQLPVITHLMPETIQLFSWGLLPDWVDDRTFQKNTLNAKIETLHEKPSFRSLVQNRCLVLADGFYEWQWLDAKGKQKQKYLLCLPDDEPFAFAGLWNLWLDPKTGEKIPTFTIVTTEANAQMAHIHNSKKRMPMILTRAEEALWLANQPVVPAQDIPLRAIPMQ